MEHWYDIYALTEQRNMETIERFLCQFADRKKIEYKKNRHFAIVPNVSDAEKHNFFNQEDNGDLKCQRFSEREKGYNELSYNLCGGSENLSPAISLGVNCPKMCFSLYIRDYVRADVSCLMLTFTLDNKLILGVSVTDKDENKKHNFVQVQNISKELQESFPVKSLSVQFENPPADNEEEFKNSKQRWDAKLTAQGFDENTRLSRINYDHSIDRQYGLYYSIFRHQLHRYYREIKGKLVYPNHSDIFTLGDAYGRVANLIKYKDDLLKQEVRYPAAYDVVALPYLGNLLYRALKPTNEDFVPMYIFKVSFTPMADRERIWQGYRDGIIYIITYEGLKVSKLQVLDSYNLFQIKDIKRLAEEGFFLFKDEFLTKSNTMAYLNWLVKYKQAHLFKALLQDKDLAIDFYGRTELPNYLE